MGLFSFDMGLPPCFLLSIAQQGDLFDPNMNVERAESVENEAPRFVDVYTLDMFGFEDLGYETWDEVEDDYWNNYEFAMYEWDEGYYAFKAGKPLDETQSERWADGWDAAAQEQCSDAHALADSREAVIDQTTLAIERACARRRRFVPYT